MCPAKWHDRSVNSSNHNTIEDNTDAKANEGGIEPNYDVEEGHEESDVVECSTGKPTNKQHI